MLAPIRLIHLIHLGEILHIVDEDIHLDGVFEACARGGEDCGDVFDALVLSPRIISMLPLM